MTSQEIFIESFTMHWHYIIIAIRLLSIMGTFFSRFDSVFPLQFANADALCDRFIMYIYSLSTSMNLTVEWGVSLDR